MGASRIRCMLEQATHNVLQTPIECWTILQHVPYGGVPFYFGTFCEGVKTHLVFSTTDQTEI